MKTSYKFFDNIIQASVTSDSGRELHAVCYIHTKGEGTMRVVESFDICNYSLTPVKFMVFCRMMVNSRLEYFYQHMDCPIDSDPVLNFELC